MKMKSNLKKCLSIFLILVLLVPSSVLGKQKEIEETAPIEFSNASVHDPSIIKAKDGSYYVFGSHIAAAKSEDLINWNSIVEGEYQTPDNNPIYGNLSENLAESFEWAGQNDSDSRGGYAVWAPDIYWNKDYVNEDGTKGAYMMYYSVSSTYIRSAIGIAVSQDIEGPYEYVDTIMYSGFTNKEAYDNNSEVNKHWENTNIKELIDNGVIDEVDPEWFTEQGNFNNALYTNAIDANILRSEDGKLYMTYGSWSGGTFILELDEETGLPKYPGKDGVTEDGRMIDRYFGTKIASGYGRSAEGTYAVYDQETDYYYLYITYGGLASDGGYQMRQFRSENIDGPYVDAEGNAAVFPENFYIDREYPANFPGNDDHKDIGNKMIGNFLFERELGEPGTGIGLGYLSPGHNSYLIDEELDKEFIVTHTRFPLQGEMHEVRVHQTFKNKDKWPVPTPYRYAGETIQNVKMKDVIGDYKFINHGKEITSELTESTWITLNKNQKISGAVTGKWKIYAGYRVELKIDNEDGTTSTYDGVFIRQYDPTSQSWVMTFSGMSDEGIVVWGSHAADSSSDEDIVVAIKEELSTSFPEQVVSDITLPTEGTRGAQISWESSNQEVISNDGTVVRPAPGESNAVVDLTATITSGDAVETLTVTITVIAQVEGGLSAYYDFNGSFEDNSGNLRDAATVTGNRLNNTGGTITFADGIAGEAAVFNGGSGLRLADGLISENVYSVSLWVKPEQITQFTTTFFGAKTSGDWISIVPQSWDNNTMVWSNNGGRWYDASSGTIILTDQWSHLALTVDQGAIEFYINGEAKFSGQGFNDVFDSINAAFGLGVNYWDTPFKGLMDEVRVYNGVALSSEEVGNLYNNPSGTSGE